MVKIEKMYNHHGLLEKTDTERETFRTQRNQQFNDKIHVSIL
jgi:hypothetical protein